MKHKQKSAAAYRRLALSPNTISCYASDVRRYRASGGKIPSTPRALANYLARQAARLRPSTLMRRLAAISYEHTRRGLRSPTRALVVQQTLRGIRRAAGARASRQAKPLSIDVLQKLVRTVAGYSRVRNCRDKALLLLGFAGGFRRSELANLRLADVFFTRRGLLVRLRTSKTDPYSQGRDVAIPYAKSQRLCPVRAVRNWIAAYKHALTPTQAKSGQTPLFARIDRYGHVHCGLSGASIGTLLKQRLTTAGVDPTGYSAHSLRSGLVTAAARAGVPAWAIQRQTGHKSYSSVHRYIRNVPVFELNAVRVLL